MSLAHLAIYLQLAGYIVLVLWRVFYGGKSKGRQDACVAELRQDMQDMHKTLSTLNDVQDKRYRQLYAEHIRFRIKVAAKLGINGD